MSLALLGLVGALGLACDKPPKSTDAPAGPTTSSAPVEQAIAPPKLVVVVVVDQMRADYFDRFGAQWQHGFARLRDEGRVYRQARHAHALTETAPGHATLATGTHPAKHGVVSNKWYARELGEQVYAVDDPEVRILANPEAQGVSAKTLMREGVGDWLQAKDPAAIVISLSLKDRAAILLGGQRPDAVIWYDDTAGAFTSSTYYYADAVPAWVDAYNQRGRAEALYGDDGWTLSQAADAYGDSRMVTEAKYVPTFNDYALTKTFPHVIAKKGKAPRNVIRDTPFGDQMTLELAREAIAAEGMGADAVPDLLVLSLSGGDYAGHRYGPYSVEIHDYYLRLDAALGAFIDDLDARLGEDYVMLLTSDHGVAPMPEYGGIATAGRYQAKGKGKGDVPALMKQVAKAMKLSKAQQPKLEFGHGVDLVWPEGVDEATKVDYRAALAEALRARPELADAWTRDELGGTDSRNEYADAWRFSFYPERAADILLQYAAGVSAYAEGTGHGTPYDYDQRVPLLIRGPGFVGIVDDLVQTVDIAPTIAALIEVEAPADLDGVALQLP